MLPSGEAALRLSTAFRPMGQRACRIRHETLVVGAVPTGPRHSRLLAPTKGECTMQALVRCRRRRPGIHLVAGGWGQPPLSWPGLMACTRLIGAGRYMGYARGAKGREGKGCAGQPPHHAHVRSNTLAHGGVPRQTPGSFRGRGLERGVVPITKTWLPPPQAVGVIGISCSLTVRHSACLAQLLRGALISEPLAFAGAPGWKDVTPDFRFTSRTSSCRVPTPSLTPCKEEKLSQRGTQPVRMQTRS